jgi:hypothetical protein
MQLRYKIGALASALALAAGVSIAFAGPAAADTDEVVMSLPLGDGYNAAYTGFFQYADVIGDSTATIVWDDPTTDGSTGEIAAWSDTTYCMEVDGATYELRLDYCKYKYASEEWTPVDVGIVLGGKTVTAYYYISDWDSALCLEGPKVDDDFLRVADCNFNGDGSQEWWLHAP